MASMMRFEKCSKNDEPLIHIQEAAGLKSACPTRNKTFAGFTRRFCCPAPSRGKGLRIMSGALGSALLLFPYGLAVVGLESGSSRHFDFEFLLAGHFSFVRVFGCLRHCFV